MIWLSGLSYQSLLSSYGPSPALAVMRIVPPSFNHQFSITYLTNSCLLVLIHILHGISMALMELPRLWLIATLKGHFVHIAWPVWQVSHGHCGHDEPWYNHLVTGLIDLDQVNVYFLHQVSGDYINWNIIW